MEKADNAKCFHCETAIELPPGPIGRGETCLNCDSDVRACLNCKFYDENSYNECAEPMAERVVDKDRANFCDYFSLGENKKSDTRIKTEALAKLDDLFKK